MNEELRPLDLSACMEATKRYEASEVVSGGPRGYIEVRRIPVWMIDGLADTKNEERAKEWARVGLVAPAVRFGDEEEGDALRWGDLSIQLQKFIVESVLAYSIEGSKEVEKAAATFRGEGPGGDPGGPDGALRDADRSAVDPAERPVPVVNGAALPVG